MNPKAAHTITSITEHVQRYVTLDYTQRAKIFEWIKDLCNPPEGVVQGVGSLRVISPTGTKQDCCLARLCELFGTGEWEGRENGLQSYRESKNHIHMVGMPPSSLMEKLGISGLETKFAYLNDDLQLSYREIALIAAYAILQDKNLGDRIAINVDYPKPLNLAEFDMQYHPEFETRWDDERKDNV